MTGAVLALLLLVLVHVALQRRAAKFAFLSPYGFMLLVNLVRIAPYSLLAILDPSVIDQRVLAQIGRSNVHNYLTHYLILESVGAAVFFTIIKPQATWAAAASDERLLSKGLAVVLFIIGLSLVMVRVDAAGGIGNLLGNLERRSELTAGYGFLVIPAYFLISLSVVVGFQRHARRRTNASLIFPLACLTIGFFSMSVFGGRKDSLLLLCTALVAYSFLVRPIPLRSPVMIVSGVVLVGYMALMAMARSPDGRELFVSDPLSAISSGVVDLVAFFKTISYLDTYLFIMSRFEELDFWGLLLFRDFPQALLPSLLYPEKPPVDEGVYVRTLLEGGVLVPPVPAKDLYPSSMPPETFGNGYIAFGSVGVIVFYAIKAHLVRLMFTIKPAYQAVALVVLVFVAYNFQVSMLRMFQCMMIFFVGIVVIVFFKLPRLRLYSRHE